MSSTPANDSSCLDDLGEVRCYCDLHRKCSSLKALQGPNKGRVVAKPVQVVLSGVRFEISQAGLRKVRETGVRNVHAYARGQVVGTDISEIVNNPAVVRITYNPHLYSQFVRVDSQAPITGADFIAIDGKTAYALGVHEPSNDEVEPPAQASLL
jgi:hypothetical protein